jgi:hypothetical protein
MDDGMTSSNLIAGIFRIQFGNDQVFFPATSGETLGAPGMVTFLHYLNPYCMCAHTLAWTHGFTVPITTVDMGLLQTLDSSLDKLV